MPIKEWGTTKKKKAVLKRKPRTKENPEKTKKENKKAKVKREKKSSLLGVYEPPKRVKKKVKAPKSTTEGFSHVWCRCTAIYKAIERTAKKCKCGWSKDHAHCSKCGGTVRVG